MWKYSVVIALLILFVCLRQKVDAGGGVYQPIASKYQNPVWKVVNKRGVMGTAFFVSKHKAVTAKHLVEKSGAISVWKGDKHYQVTKIQFWTDKDLAILEVSETIQDVLSVDTENAFWGQPILVVGYPMGLNCIPTFGYCAGLVDSPYKPGLKVLSLSCRAVPGYSGSPVINANNGKVVGVLVGGYPKYAHMSYAEPIEKIKDLLR